MSFKLSDLADASAVYLGSTSVSALMLGAGSVWTDVDESFAITGIVTDGDSITDLIDTSTDPAYPSPAIWLQTITGTPVINIAKSGITLQTLDASFNDRSTATPLPTRYTGDVAALAATYNTLVINAGTNDAFGSKTAVQMQGWLTSYCQKAKLAGFRVFVSTFTPRNGGITGELASFQTWVKANWATIADGLVDYDAITDWNGDSPSSGNLTTLWTTDGLHPSGSLHAAMAEKMRAALGLASIVSDATPNAITFSSISDVAVDSTVVSAAVAVKGLTAPAAITVSGGGYRINGGPTRTAPGLVGPFDYLQLVGTASSSPNTTSTVTATVGGVATSFSFTTAAVAATTLNPLDKSATITLTNGNLTATSTGGTNAGVRGTKSISSGTHTYSVTVNAKDTDNFVVGVGTASAALDNYVGSTSSTGVGWYSSNAFIPSFAGSSVGVPVVGDVLDIEFTAETKVLRVRKNGGAWGSYTASSLGAGPYYPMLTIQGGAGIQLTADFTNW